MRLCISTLAVIIGCSAAANCRAATLITLPTNAVVQAGETTFFDVDIGSDSADPLSEFLAEFRITRTSGAGLLQFIDIPFDDPLETLQSDRYVLAADSLVEILGQTVGSVSLTSFPADTLIASDVALASPVTLGDTPKLLVRLGLDAALATPGDQFSVTLVNVSLNGVSQTFVPPPTAAVSITAAPTGVVPEPPTAAMLLGVLGFLMRRRLPRTLRLRRFRGD